MDVGVVECGNSGGEWKGRWVVDGEEGKVEVAGESERGNWGEEAWFEMSEMVALVDTPTGWNSPTLWPFVSTMGINDWQNYVSALAL